MTLWFAFSAILTNIHYPSLWCGYAFILGPRTFSQTCVLRIDLCIWDTETKADHNYPQSCNYLAPDDSMKTILDLNFKDIVMDQQKAGTPYIIWHLDELIF